MVPSSGTHTHSPLPSVLAWHAVPFPAQPDCLLIVYQCTCTRTRAPHPTIQPDMPVPHQERIEWEHIAAAAAAAAARAPVAPSRQLPR